MKFIRSVPIFVFLLIVSGYNANNMVGQDSGPNSGLNEGYILPEEYLRNIDLGNEIGYGSGRTVINNYSIYNSLFGMLKSARQIEEHAFENLYNRLRRIQTNIST